MLDRKHKPATWVQSLNCAIEGILWAAKTQRHMRIHFCAAVLFLFLAVFLHLSALEFILLAFAVTLVLFAELFNTAIETLVDLVSPDYHELAKRAKDVAAGAVLVASIGAVVMGYFSLARHVFPVLGAELDQFGEAPGEFPVISVLVVSILVVLLKARFGKGNPLHGGMPSGHAAIAFSVATAVALSHAGVVPFLLVLVLAALVARSRVQLGIHSVLEVVAGGSLGAMMTVIVYLVF